jgi:hypothetical protein
VNVLAVIRYTVPESQSQDFAKQGHAILDTLATQALVSEWEGAGFYRRALSAARMAMYPLMILMVNEPSAFEDVYLQDRA